MSSELSNFLLGINAIKVLRVIFYAQRHYSLRSIATFSGISPSTAMGVIYQLVSNKVIKKNYKGKQTYYTLSVSEDEKALLGNIFSEYEKNYIRSGTAELSRKAVSKISWIDETLESLHRAKSQNSGQ